MSGLELGKVLYGSKYQFGQEEMTKELNELSDRILEEYENASDHPEYRHFLKGYFSEILRGR